MSREHATVFLDFISHNQLDFRNASLVNKDFEVLKTDSNQLGTILNQFEAKMNSALNNWNWAGTGTELELEVELGWNWAGTGLELGWN